MRRRAVTAGGLASMALVAGGLAWVRAGDAPADDGGGDPAAPEATAQVERRDLQERAELDGTLGYGEATEVTLGAGATGDDGDDTGEAPTGDDSGSGGTITALPAVGTLVDRGQTLVEVDGRPVPLLIGPRPLWRELGPDAEDGPDVEQVERNLLDMGIVTADELTVDQSWTGATTDAVEEWQEALGVEETGTLGPGDVVFQPGPVRVVEHPTPVGGSASGSVLEVSGTTKVVTVDLEATSQSLLSEGQDVEVELPDGTAAGGTVFDVGTVATVPDDGDSEVPGEDTGGDATVEVVVALDDPAQAGTYDEAPVTVRVVTSAAEGVLAVPVDALLALAEGGYAVERVTRGGTELVGVEIGAFADGWVEVTGDLAEGDEVGVPAS